LQNCSIDLIIEVVKKIKVGVIGVGHMGEYHTRTYTEIPNVELVCVVDIRKDRAERIAKEYHTTPYTDYRKIYEYVDAVSIAVPTSVHYPVAKDFLSKGKNVLLEKPMTKSLAEAEELIELAERKGVLLQVGHVERFNAAVCELKNIVKNPIFIDAQRLSPKNFRINDTGVILDLLIHDIDIVLNLVSSEIEKVSVAAASVYSDYEDIANVQIKFANGCLASITGSRVTEEKIRRLAVTQEDAYIFLDYAEQDLRIHRRASSEYFTSQEVLRYKQESFIERIFVHKDNPLKLELAHFIDCIVNGNTPILSHREDLISLKTTLDILKIAEEEKNGF
jgi:predicted dehydrogenase